jgi:hypothetical protein
MYKTGKNGGAARSGHIQMEPIKYGENKSMQFLKYCFNDIEIRSNISEDGIRRIYH